MEQKKPQNICGFFLLREIFAGGITACSGQYD